MKRISKFLFASALAGALGGGCATSGYVFAPAEQATASIGGYPAANYALPPEGPRGKLEAASFGIVAMQVNDGGAETRFLQVRLSVANNNDVAAWTVDTRQQLLALPGEGQSRPAFANSDQQDLPNITVAPGQKRTIDLYYALPLPLQSADHIPQFELLWHVQTPSREVAERTPFERIKIEEPSAWAYADEYPDGYPYGYFGYGSLGWGATWWYDPFFPSFTFAHPVFIAPHHPFVAHHGFAAPGRVHAVGRPAFGGHPGAFGHPGAGYPGAVGHPGGFAGGRPPGTFHAGGGFHGGGPGGGFHGGSPSGGFHGGSPGGGFHGGGPGGGFHGGGPGGGFHGGSPGGGFHGGGPGGGFHGGGPGGGFHGGGGGGHGGGHH